jgi:hypothetical protein
VDWLSKIFKLDFSFQNSALVFLCVLACAYGASVPDAAKAETLKESFDQNPDGGFQYALETSNGISSRVEGQVKPVGKVTFCFCIYYVLCLFHGRKLPWVDAKIRIFTEAF